MIPIISGMSASSMGSHDNTVKSYLLMHVQFSEDLRRIEEVLVVNNSG